MTDTFYADVSYFQTPVTDAYPHPMIAFRVDWGGGIDDNARANWAWASAHPRVQVVIAYVVFKPGQVNATMKRLTDFFGQSAPRKLVVMIDMESGSGFAGPGDHSPGANALANALAVWLGDKRRVIGYANGNDWAGCWPSAPSWMKRVQASYGTNSPDAWGWQYYGGDARWPSPAGYPRSCPPFGANVDMNVIHKPIGQIAADCGLAAPVPVKPTPNTPTPETPVTKSDLPTTGPLATPFSNPDTGAKRTGAGWIIRIVQQLNQIGADVAAIRKMLEQKG
jgi:hypothetical protein